MLSERSSVDIHALKRQGMTISEIARRTGHDRKTIRAYLNGDASPVFAVSASRTRLLRSSTTFGNASMTTRTSGSQRCWMSCVRWGSRGPIRR
ncbi:helix-turn-helix domain-containing protein [Microbacterium kunmingense]|uniref:helix-turn-helix domain-containing protein n=1 Tax=Microbacterium kunmingense TaxID=2915939 RepID=UPI003556D4D3